MQIAARAAILAALVLKGDILSWPSAAISPSHEQRWCSSAYRSKAATRAHEGLIAAYK